MLNLTSLSVIIPVYNERSTIAAVVLAVSRVLPQVSKQIIIVDDCSTDGTREWLQSNFADVEKVGSSIDIDPDGNVVFSTAPGSADITVRCLYHGKTRGKGAAIQSSLAAATCDVIVIQDADLEYDPEDWTKMYELVAVRSLADVVYGSRFSALPRRSLYFHHYLGNRLITLLFNLLYNQTLSDIEVCYKMFSRAVKDELRITCNDFGVEVQISAQIALARKWRIYEVAIHYYGRTYNEGKKVNWKDGFKAIWYLLKYRLSSH